MLEDHQQQKVWSWFGLLYFSSYHSYILFQKWLGWYASTFPQLPCLIFMFVNCVAYLECVVYMTGSFRILEASLIAWQQVLALFQRPPWQVWFLRLLPCFFLTQVGGCTEVVEHIGLIGEIGFWTFVFRVVSLSLCSRKDCFISGSLDRTVLLWDQRAEKCQVGALAYGYWVRFLILHVFLWMIIICVRILGSLTRTRKACHNLWWSRASFCSCLWWVHKNVWCPQVWKGQLFIFQCIWQLKFCSRVNCIMCIWQFKHGWSGCLNCFILLGSFWYLFCWGRYVWCKCCKVQ